MYRSDSLLSNDVEIVPSDLDTLKLDIRYSIAVLNDTPKVNTLLDIFKEPSFEKVYEDFGLIYHDVTP